MDSLRSDGILSRRLALFGICLLCLASCVTVVEQYDVHLYVTLPCSSWSTDGDDTEWFEISVILGREYGPEGCSEGGTTCGGVAGTTTRCDVEAGIEFSIDHLPEGLGIRVDGASASAAVVKSVPGAGSYEVSITAGDYSGQSGSSDVACCLSDYSCY